MVKCICIVESKPSSMVHFLLSNRVLSSTKVEIHGPVSIGTLQANLGSFRIIHCVANNTVGNANIILTFPDKSKKYLEFQVCITCLYDVPPDCYHIDKRKLTPYGFCLNRSDTDSCHRQWSCSCDFGDTNSGGSG